MSAKKQLILLPSTSMDSNKKEGRNENLLVRMSSNVRKIMNYTDDAVELWSGNTSSERLRTSTQLEIFKAFSDDIKKVKKMVEIGDLTEEEATRVGFVTTKTFNNMFGKQEGKKANIWISNSVEDTVIGADPEFLLFNATGDIVNASTIAGFSRSGKVGHDGAMAEFRPVPGITPAELTDNILDIIKNDANIKSIRQLTWKSAAYHSDKHRGYPVGGHIHIGNPVQIAKLSVEDRTRFFILVNKIMDELVTIPMSRLDGEEGSIRRIKSNMGKYGYFGDFRLCNGRLEHRTLSGIWLTHPDLARAVFGVVKLIIDEVFKTVSERNFDKQYILLPNNISRSSLYQKGFDGWSSIKMLQDLGCTKSSDEMISLINECNAQKINKVFLNKWKSQLRKYSTYSRYEEYVNILFEILSKPVKQIREMDKNIQANWLGNKKFELI